MGDWFNRVAAAFQRASGPGRMPQDHNRGARVQSLIEHERRFLIDGTIPAGNESRIEQAYLTKSLIGLTATVLSVGSNPIIRISLSAQQYEQIQAIWNQAVVRIRNVDGDWCVGIKGPKRDGKGLEIEFPITAQQGRHNFDNANAGSITKQRRYVPLGGGVTAEVDIFLGRLYPLVIVEVENPPDDFVVPNWFGVEITGLHEFSNATLAMADEAPDYPEDEQ